MTERKITKKQFQDYVQRFIPKAQARILEDSHIAEVMADVDPKLAAMMRGVIELHRELYEYVVSRAEYYPRTSLIRGK